ncbi:MAG TPA: isoprenylcysteine carboxylmethyltransferase family protein [Terracidiphilus sp.]|jgi:protein-S-isoprenylcysteine O-methyltransferase Ste14|nr:isoprenylcysteine carboxylmethyltransferase family protein [Terracidiphilus sp.]
MGMLYRYLFVAIWIVFLVYWQIRARGTKTTERLEPIASRIVRVLVFLVAIALLMLQNIPLYWLYWHILPVGRTLFFVGAAITTAGVLFAALARGFLGANWSRSVTIKQDHELIVRGPYALVRHPIYTGILTGFLGTAIALGQIRGFIALIMIGLVLWAKLRMEEQWMRAQFGATYEAYARRVAALVPFVL